MSATLQAGICLSLLTVCASAEEGTLWSWGFEDGMGILRLEAGGRGVGRQRL